MHITKTTNINIQNNGYPMMGLSTPMMGGGMPSIFGMGYPMGMACGLPNNEMAAGYCTGRLLSMPGVLSGIGKGLSWFGKHVMAPAGKFLWNGIAKPIYNGFLKPIGNFMWNSVLKPVGKAIGKGVSWVWDNTLGALFKKKSKKTENS
ncbi:hypothetical protein J6G99_04970 [bacterium]|nr:hypothetical protein [bacterium]